MHSQLDEERDTDTQVADVIIQYPRNNCACGRQLRLRPGGNGRSRGRPLLVATDDGLQCAIEIVKVCNDCKRNYFHNYYDEDVGDPHGNDDAAIGWVGYCEVLIR